MDYTDGYAYEKYFYYKGDWLRNLKAIFSEAKKQTGLLSGKIMKALSAAFRTVFSSDPFGDKFVGVVKIIFLIPALIALCLLVPPFLLAFLLLFCSIFFVFFLISNILVMNLLFINWCYLTYKGYYILCRHCDRKIKYPVYFCDNQNCKKGHYLFPTARYGVFHKKCVCGRKLPTTIFGGRKKLKAICPESDCGHEITWADENVVPRVIAICGGTYAGKSLFLQTLITYLVEHKMIDLEEVRKNCGEDNQRWAEQLLNNSRAGILPVKTPVNKLTRPHCVNYTSERNYRFYFFDQAGELSQEYQKQIAQRYFNWLDTVVFVIDPFSLPEIQKDFLDKGFKMPGMYSKAPPDILFSILKQTMIDIFHNCFERAKCIVVITKTDLPYFKEVAGLSPKSTHEECRNFLSTFGSSNLITQIEETFPNRVLYSSVSLTGGVPGGRAFEPSDLDEIVKELFATRKAKLNGA